MTARAFGSITPGSTTAWTRWVAVGDVIVIATFVVLGELSHGISPLADPLATVETLIPFLVGWTVVGRFAGAYRSEATREWRPALRAASLGWVGGALLGQALRATAWFRGDAAPTFVVVSIVVGAALLVSWRFAVTVFASRVSPVQDDGDE